ncbi:unnamed protein product [Tuber aestivum]|uniref:Uncharacterized protein n=1 Tax=Tuber aestivum TaxID=59557 RepID=A0A292Q6A8_9PEZI|nr:unnamed protein product [Tuber aestivum]
MLKEVEHSHRHCSEDRPQRPNRSLGEQGVIWGLGPNDWLAINPAPPTESGWEGMFVIDIDRRDWGETETEEEQELSQKAISCEGTLTRIPSALWCNVLRGVILSRAFGRVMASMLDYLRGLVLVLRAYRHGGDNGAAE